MVVKSKSRHVALIQEDQTATTVYDRVSLDVFARAVARELEPGGQMDDVPDDFAAGYVWCLADILNGNMSIISPQGSIRRALAAYAGTPARTQRRVSVDGR